MVPDIGLALKKTDWVIPAFVGIMLGIAGFTMDTSSLVKQATNFRAVVPVLVSIYIFSPLAAYGLAKLLAPVGNQDFLPAMMIMAAQAGSLASAIALTMMSGGNRELALICTVMSNGLTFLLTPFILHLSVRSQEDFPVAELMQRMVCAGSRLPDLESRSTSHRRDRRQRQAWQRRCAVPGTRHQGANRCVTKVVDTGNAGRDFRSGRDNHPATTDGRKHKPQRRRG